MSELFSDAEIDPTVEKLYMYPGVFTDDAMSMVDSYNELNRAGLSLDEIITELEDRHPIDADELRTWLLEDR